MLLDLRALLEALGAGRDDERGVAARAELAVDRGDDDVDVGDAAVGGPGLLAVDDPLVGGLVVLGVGADRRDVGAGVGLGRAEGGDLRIVGGAEALDWIHSPICSGVPWPKIAATASEVPMIDMPIPASPQNSSSLTIGSVSPDWSNQNWARPS